MPDVTHLRAAIAKRLSDEEHRSETDHDYLYRASAVIDVIVQVEHLETLRALVKAGDHAAA